MKSKIVQSLFCAVVAVGMMACAGAAPNTVRSPNTGNIEMPPWVLQQPELCGVGVQEFRGNVGMAKTASEAKARTDLSSQLETKVKAMVKQYNQEGGTADGDFSEEQTTAVSVSLTKQTLQGAVPTKASLTGGRYYALVCLKPGVLTDAIEQMKELGEAQRAALAKRAAKAHEDLEEQMKTY